jgi:hypothetical protein
VSRPSTVDGREEVSAVSVTSDWKNLHRLRAMAAERLLRVDLRDDSSAYVVTSQSGVRQLESPSSAEVETFIRRARRPQVPGSVTAVWRDGAA